MSVTTTLHRLRNILVRTPNWVGDGIMATPSIRAIRKAFPAARITILAKPWVIPVYQFNPNIDTIMAYDAGGRHRGLVGLMRLGRDLHQRRFDLAILFQNAFEAAFLAAIAGIPHRLGYTTDVRTAFLTERVYNWRRYRKGHLIDYYRGILQESGIPAESRRMALFLRPEERTQAERRCRRLGRKAGRPVIGINPGATYGTAKRWLPDRYAEVCRRLVRATGGICIVFGAPAEAALGERIANDAGGGVVNLCGKTNLRLAMALIEMCDLFITNDSGLMHVAAALSRPLVAIIGPTDILATGPVSENHRIVRSHEVCRKSPCLEPECPLGHQRCMTDITTDQVFNTVMHMLNR